MPMKMATVSIATLVTVENLIAGSAFEFPQRRGIISEGICSDTSGVYCQLQAGSDLIAEEFIIPTLNRYPIIPDEMYFGDVVEVGDRIIQRVRNPTGGTVVVRSALQYTPAV